MRPGLSSFAFGWAVRHGRPPLDELCLIGIAKRHALSVVQLGDNLPVHDMSPRRRARMRAALAAAKIDLELGARGLTRAHLVTYLALSEEFGCRLLRFVIDQGGYKPDFRTVVSLLKKAEPDLRAAGVTLGLENHDRFPAALLREIVDVVDSPHVGVCLDTANSLGAGEGLAEVTRVLAPVTVNLHLKDVVISRVRHQMGFVIEGCPLGEGCLPLAESVRAVRAAGRCRTTILEAWSPEDRTLAGTVRREAAWARRSLAAFRTMVEGATPVECESRATIRPTKVAQKRRT